MRPIVLCVDDDRNLCQILARALTSEGYLVRVAHDGDEALASVGEEPPDLVLLDLLLPKRDGFAVLEALRGLGGDVAKVPVVLLSGGLRSPQYVERARALGASAMLAKPTPLDELLQTIARQLPNACESDPEPSSHVPLTGSLVDVPFPALLHHLHGLRATGVLQLQHGKRKKALQLKDGYPVAVRSNLVGECLGNFLVRTGRISERDLDESIRRLKSGEGRQGEILVAMQVLAEEEIGPALSAQAEEKLFEIFEWTGGGFEVQIGACLDGGSGLALERSPANLILHGVRRRFPLSRVDAHLAASAERFVAQNESPFHRFQEIDLDPDEMRLFGSLDGSRRLSDLLGSPEPVRRTLYALLATDLLELIDGGRAASTAPPVPSAPEPAADALRGELTALAERMRGRTWFDILGVTERSSDEEVRSAYVALARRTHPDRYSGASEPVKRLAEEVFGLVSKAYEALGDGARRARYAFEARNAGDLDEGRRALEAELQFQQGEAKLRARKYAEAAECFGRAVELYPEEGEYHARLGWTEYLSGPDDAAVCERALARIKHGARLAPDRDAPFLYLGRIFRATGRTDLAEKMLTRAISNKPDCIEALRELRLIHMRREKGKGLIGRLLRR
ncbi:MAG: response regulator [Deltaproteobacteria bacterium]|nr:response regulator [Deltaproteobacteria bacterium]